MGKVSETANDSGPSFQCTDFFFMPRSPQVRDQQSTYLHKNAHKLNNLFTLLLNVFYNKLLKQEKGKVEEHLLYKRKLLTCKNF